MVAPSSELFRPLAPIPNSKFLQRGENTWEKDGKNWRFSMEIAVYLGNGAR